MKILFYGRLAEAIGRELEGGMSAGCSVAELRQKLAAEHPQVASVFNEGRVLTFVGDQRVGDDYRPAPGETLEFLPPVSGG